ncbi:MAG: YopX family protein [Bacilli bacterium]|nr:YopX family protein [Bacilli bacterium]
MRQIKFRCWVLEKNDFEDINEIKYDACGYFQYLQTYEGDHYDLEEIVLLQYTGLKDKNGKEIYEGDIITYHNFIKFTGIVWWCDKDATYLVDLSQTKNKFINTSNHQITLSSVLGGDNDTEVIGNIYENPEMLKGD